MPLRPSVSSQTYYFSDLAENVVSPLSAEEKEAAEESLSVYCRPVKLYNILRGRAYENPSFLTRCLDYKLKEKHKRSNAFDVSPTRGDVIFKFKYYNDMLLEEEDSAVMEDYTCPYCRIECASYTGLRCHLLASHDLFDYEFLVYGHYQVVFVFPKTMASTSEMVGKKLDPGDKAFYFCRKTMRRRKAEKPTQNTNHAQPLALDLNTPAISELMELSPS